MTNFELKPGDGKIYIGIPRERFLLPQFVDCRDNILHRLHVIGKDAGYFQTDGHRVDRNRDKISDQFLNYTTAEWLLMLDSDMEIPIRAPERLVAFNKPVIGALYFHRGESHDPFIFKEADKRKDQYGRPLRTWISMKKTVYDYLVKNNVPLRDGAITIDNGYGDPLIECDAIATGCMLIHRSVLEALKPPYFEYEVGGLSEDLTFSWRIHHELGIPLYCDISTICGHYHMVPMGQAQFRIKYEGRPITQSGFSRVDAINLVSKFRKIPEKKAKDLIDKSDAAMVGELWKQQFNGTEPSPEKVREFYKSRKVGSKYLLELIHWNVTPTFTQIRTPLLKYRELDALEVGSGIGTVAMQLLFQDCNVLAIETNSLLRNFIDFRWKMYQEITKEEISKQLSIVDESWITKTPDKSFDLAVALDVFEHVPEEELRLILGNLQRVLKPKGILYYHNNFGQQDLYPMHYDFSDKWNPWLKEFGFTPISPYEAMKL